MKPVAPNKRFLRAVRDERVFVHIYEHDTKGRTWRSYPFGMWFVIEHQKEGYVNSYLDEGTLPAKIYTQPGVLILLTDKGREYLNTLP